MEQEGNILDRFDRIMLLLVALSTLGGTLGWMQYMLMTGDEPQLDIAFYRSLQLFVFSDVAAQPGLPLLLKITRFLSPALLATAIIRQLIISTSRGWDYFRIKNLFSNHYIICGLGAVGYKIATDSLSEGVKVVVIEKNSQNPAISDVRKLGAIVINGDATDKSILKRAGITDAAALFTVTEDDTVNLGIFYQAQQLREGRKTRLQKVIRFFSSVFSKQYKNSQYRNRHLPEQQRFLVHIAESATINLVYNSKYCQQKAIEGNPSAEPALENAASRTRFLKPFNINQIAASRVISEYPPDEYYPVHTSGSGPVHLLLAGLGNIGESLLLAFARNAHYFCNIPAENEDVVSRKNVVHIVATHTAERLNEIRALYPGLDQVVECRVCEASTLSLSSGELKNIVDTFDIRLAYLCLEDDIERYTALHTFGQYLLRHKLMVVNVMPSRAMSAFSIIMPNDEKSCSDTKSGIVDFSIIERTCRKSILINEKLDNIAMRIHAIHQSGNRPAQPDEAEAAWARLPENFMKMSSRYSAEHLPVKLRAMTQGNGIAGAAEAEELLKNAELLEKLEHIEHIRFVAERLLEGWVPASPEQENLPAAELKKLKQLKINKTLRPFRRLAEEDKAFNREFLKIIPTLIE